MQQIPDQEERLLDELIDFLYSVTDKDFDSKRLDEILNALEEIAPIEAFSVEEGLQKFGERFNRLTEEERSKLAEGY